MQSLWPTLPMPNPCPYINGFYESNSILAEYTLLCITVHCRTSLNMFVWKIPNTHFYPKVFLGTIVYLDGSASPHGYPICISSSMFLCSPNLSLVLFSFSFYHCLSQFLRHNPWPTCIRVNLESISCIYHCFLIYSDILKDKDISHLGTLAPSVVPETF